MTLVVLEFVVWFWTVTNSVVRFNTAERAANSGREYSGQRRPQTSVQG